MPSSGKWFQRCQICIYLIRAAIAFSNKDWKELEGKSLCNTTIKETCFDDEYYDLSEKNDDYY